MINGDLKRHQEYAWITLTFVTWWTQTQSFVLCFGVPIDMQHRLESRLRDGQHLSSQDPFALLVPLLDEILKQYDESVWRIRDHIREVEEVCD
jgi:Mg2+ and Co2+ transporter CorA